MVTMMRKMSKTFSGAQLEKRRVSQAEFHSAIVAIFSPIVHLSIKQTHHVEFVRQDIGLVRKC